MDQPFPAYQGDEPYVFVCYAHDDSAVVYPEMQWLRDQGVNVWYDEGISAGTNWRAAIGDHLLKASHVLFYISQHSLTSDHCNREINLALDERKHVVPVYLEDVDLTSDLKVGLNRVQAIHRFEIDEKEYRDKLSAAMELPSSTGLEEYPRAKRRSWVAPSAALVVEVSGVTGHVEGTKALVASLNGVVDRVLVSVRDDREKADITLRVFTADFKQAMDFLEGQGKVKSKELREGSPPVKVGSAPAEKPDARIDVSFAEEFTSVNVGLIVGIIAGVVLASALVLAFYGVYRFGAHRQRSSS